MKQRQKHLVALLVLAAMLASGAARSSLVRSEEVRTGTAVEEDGAQEGTTTQDGVDPSTAGSAWWTGGYSPDSGKPKAPERTGQGEELAFGYIERPKDRDPPQFSSLDILRNGVPQTVATTGAESDEWALPEGESVQLRIRAVVVDRGTYPTGVDRVELEFAGTLFQMTKTSTADTWEWSATLSREADYGKVFVWSAQATDARRGGAEGGNTITVGAYKTYMEGSVQPTGGAGPGGGARAPGGFQEPPNLDDWRGGLTREWVAVDGRYVPMRYVVAYDTGQKCAEQFSQAEAYQFYSDGKIVYADGSTQSYDPDVWDDWNSRRWFAWYDTADWYVVGDEDDTEKFRKRNGNFYGWAWWTSSSYQTWWSEPKADWGDEWANDGDSNYAWETAWQHDSRNPENAGHYEDPHASGGQAAQEEEQVAQEEEQAAQEEEQEGNWWTDFWGQFGLSVAVVVAAPSAATSWGW